MSRKYRKEKTVERQAMLNATADEVELEAMKQEMAEEEAQLVDFDGWWAARASRIPTQHRKEIIKADFRGRGLSHRESMDSFDEALKEYGIRI